MIDGRLKRKKSEKSRYFKLEGPKLKVLVVCGPTATGKTQLALDLSRKFKANIISADSRQVYKYMDVVTGKDIPEGFWFRSVHHSLFPKTFGCYSDDEVSLYGYDLVFPDQDFSVKHFLESAYWVANNSWMRGDTLLIVVGGTGMYIKAFLDPPETVVVPVNLSLRAELGNGDVDMLMRRLQEIDIRKYESMNMSDRVNPVRLIRAIEVAEYRKLHPEHLGSHNSIADLSWWKPKLSFEVLQIGLTFNDREVLYKRIDQRVERRLGKLMDQEIAYLKRRHWLTRAPSRTIGYQQWIDYLHGEVSKEEAVRRWKFAEHGFARRQLTWFKKQTEIRWFDVSTSDYQLQISNMVDVWLDM